MSVAVENEGRERRKIREVAREYRRQGYRVIAEPSGSDLPAFLGSCAYLSGMMASVAFSIYPFVLPSSTDPERGLTIHAAAAHPSSLRIALAWWIPGILLAGGYFVFVYRKFAGRVTPNDDHY